MKKKIGILIIIIALVCFIVLWNNREKIIELENNIKSEIYGEPIYEDGTINNKFWGIESNGTKPIETRRGLSNAIDYASKNNIRYIKLEKGTYLVNCYSNESVVLKSNIEFDLNGSTIKQNLVNQKRYNVLSIHNVENVRVFNGKIEGDKETHKYTEENESAELGMGLSLRGCKNVEITNLEICNMTGDGIYINESLENKVSDVKIFNCNIHTSRRQGISIITGKNIFIENNNIHNIRGIDPQSGIDIERNEEEQTSDNIYIKNNTFYNIEHNCILSFYGITNLYIQNNIFYGKNNIKDKKEETYVIENNEFIE